MDKDVLTYEEWKSTYVKEIPDQIRNALMQMQGSTDEEMYQHEYQIYLSNRAAALAS